MNDNSLRADIAEKEQFLDEESRTSSEELLRDEFSEAHRPASRRRLHMTITIAIFWLALNAIWSIYLAFHQSSDQHNHGPNLIHSPARSAVNYETITTNSTVYNTNKFRGKPTPEVTDAWHSSYTKWARVVVSEEDMKAIGRESIPLSDGSGYLATLDVFHQIHCLNTIREYIFKDYYWSKEEDGRRWEHVDHCIDTLRLAAMCQGDIALVPFKWQDDELLPQPQFHTEHECRKWDNILEWAQDRQADMSLVVRPS